MANDKVKEQLCLLTRSDIDDIVEGMDEVPSTTGVQQYLVIREAFEVNRYQHICVQPRFQDWSPEELRWKHQFNEENFY